MTKDIGAYGFARNMFVTIVGEMIDRGVLTEAQAEKMIKRLDETNERTLEPAAREIASRAMGDIYASLLQSRRPPNDPSEPPQS